MSKHGVLASNSFLIQKRTKKTFEEKQAKKKASTRQVMGSMLRKFEKFCKSQWNGKGMEQVIDELVSLKKSMDLEEFKDTIYEGVLNPYLSYLSKEGIMRRTQTMYFSTVNTYLHHRGISLNEKDNRDNLEFEALEEDELYPITLEDIQKIFTVIPPKKKALYYALLSTGCRPGELIQVRKRDLDFSQKRVMIKISSKNTKTHKSRTVFLTKEATSYLMPRLKQLDDNDLVFTDNPNAKDVVTKEGILFGQWLDKIGFDAKYESNGRRKITMYSFRSYFFGVCADAHREAYAHRMTGHGGYLKQYDRWSNEKKLEYYLKVEPLLTVSDDERNKVERQKIEVEKKELEEKTHVIEELSKRIDQFDAQQKELLQAFKLVQSGKATIEGIENGEINLRFTQKGVKK